MKDVSVLLIDDDEIERRLFEAYAFQIDRFNLDVAYAPSVSDAETILKGDAPDILFLDNRLTPYDEFRETLPVIRDAGYCGPVVVISATPPRVSKHEYNEHGVSASLDKLSLSASLLEATIVGCLTAPKNIEPSV